MATRCRGGITPDLTFPIQITSSLFWFVIDNINHETNQITQNNNGFMDEQLENSLAMYLQYHVAFAFSNQF